jgi:hypothetical protein
MSTLLADSASNPYASPAPVVTAEKPKEELKVNMGSVGIILGGLVLMLVGYLTSNLFLMSDLYHIGMGPDGKEMPSPFAAALTSPAQLWLVYILCASACVVGAVMIGSQAFNPITAVCYIMCPLAAVVCLVGAPLRIAKKYATAVATIYLGIGSCLACTGAMRLVQLYQLPNNEFEPVLASMLTEAGLALVLGAIVKFWRCTPSAAAINAAAADSNELVGHPA